MEWNGLGLPVPWVGTYPYPYPCAAATDAARTRSLARMPIPGQRAAVWFRGAVSRSWSWLCCVEDLPTYLARFAVSYRVVVSIESVLVVLGHHAMSYRLHTTLLTWH
jgi:hypothetical protein